MIVKVNTHASGQQIDLVMFSITVLWVQVYFHLRPVCWWATNGTEIFITSSQSKIIAIVFVLCVLVLTLFEWDVLLIELQHLKCRIDLVSCFVGFV